MVGIGNGFDTPRPGRIEGVPGKRGLVVGLMVGGHGAGSAILGPLATRLITAVGWRSTFQILAAVFFVMTWLGPFS
jgi:OFA family oxalate/formate antiporter-like MFS transporter